MPTEKERDGFDFALPLYSYQNILELQDRFEKDTTSGRHLYEGNEVDWNEWLPSPVPASFKVGRLSAKIENRNKALIAEFERAEETGVVMRDDLGYWNIMVTEIFDTNFFLAADSYEKGSRTDNDKLDALIARLETEMERQKNSARPVRIKSLKARPGSERQVMLDFYLKSPVLNRKLHNELEKRETMAKRIAELRDFRDGNIIFAKEQKDFFNAIYTGVLFYGNEITYSYDGLGEEKVVELHNNAMPLGDTGAYQAFLNFRTMNADIKKRIIAETKNRMKEEASPKVMAAVEKPDANMPKRIARCNMLHDETDPLHEELERFYGEFMKALREFVSLHQQHEEDKRRIQFRDDD